jgi:hypothetical protein
MNDRSRTPARSISALLLIAVLSLVTAQACGPFFSPDVFVLKMRPDKPKDFAAGSLGVLLPTYPRQDLIVAFRYLNGGTLSQQEQRAYEPTYAGDDPEEYRRWSTDDAQDFGTGGQPFNAGGSEQSGPDQTQSRLTPPELWKKVRDRFAAPTSLANPERSEKIKIANGSSYETNFINCGPSSFETAIATLQARAKTWGAKGPELVDWIKGQDAVFSNCSDGPLALPAPAAPDAPALLKADRAYQIAAAQFYGMRFGDARAGFEAVGHDEGSPWNGIARYLAARCLIRQAFYAQDARGAEWGSPAPFDPSLMRQAADLLKSLLKENLPGISRHAIQSELDFVRIRIEPDARLRELSAALTGPKSGPDYRQHLIDLAWSLDSKLDELPVREDTDDYRFQPPNQQGADIITPTSAAKDAAFSNTYRDLAKLRSDSTLVDWLITFQSPATEAKDHAIAEWQKTHTLYWLLAAISKATAQDPAAPDLIAAAAELKPEAPAAESFTYHRIRLLIATGKAAEARSLLDQSLPLVRKNGRDSSINLYLGLKARASASLAEFLANAPRKIISNTSESQASLSECLDVMKNPKRVYDCARKVDPVQFSDDAAAFFNAQAPLSVLIESANSSALPQQLRQSIAEMAWVRAILLNDHGAAAKLEPLLPPKLIQQAAPRSGPLMTLLRNPGLRPYLDPGVQRSYSYDFVESYRDNWWSADWAGSDYSSTPAPRGPQPVAFLTSAQNAQAQKELDELLKLGPADTHLGQLALDYAIAHPDDPDVAESLYLVLRMIRYSSSSYGYDDNSPARKHYLTSNPTLNSPAWAPTGAPRSWPASPRS